MGCGASKKKPGDEPALDDLRALPEDHADDQRTPEHHKPRRSSPTHKLSHKDSEVDKHVATPHEGHTYYIPPEDMPAPDVPTLDAPPQANAGATTDAGPGAATIYTSNMTSEQKVQAFREAYIKKYLDNEEGRVSEAKAIMEEGKNAAQIAEMSALLTIILSEAECKALVTAVQSGANEPDTGVISQDAFQKWLVDDTEAMKNFSVK